MADLKDKLEGVKENVKGSADRARAEGHSAAADLHKDPADKLEDKVKEGVDRVSGAVHDAKADIHKNKP